MDSYDVIDSHPTWKQRAPVTYNGACGLVSAVLQNAAGDLFLEIEGPSFDENTAYPVQDCALGGTPETYPPTLQAHPFDARSYTVTKLAQADGLVPPGWAVLHKHDGVYVAWGLPSKSTAETFAVAHQAGVHFFGSKM